MKTFKFRLKRLLDVRRIEENQASLKLREAIGRLQAIDARIDAARSEHAEVYRELAASLSEGPLGAEAPLQASTHAARIERAICEAERERVVAEQSVRQARMEHRRRRIARKALEELQTRAIEDWKDAVRRDENAFLDEVASTRHARGGG